MLSCNYSKWKDLDLKLSKRHQLHVVEQGGQPRNCSDTVHPICARLDRLCSPSRKHAMTMIPDGLTFCDAWVSGANTMDRGSFMCGLLPLPKGRFSAASFLGTTTALPIDTKGDISPRTDGLLLSTCDPSPAPAPCTAACIKGTGNVASMVSWRRED